jgi:hypothetical protein
MPKEWNAKQGEELQENLAYAAPNDRARQPPGKETTRSKRTRCTQGKSVKSLCVKSTARVTQPLSNEFGEALDYAAHAIRTRPERIQAVIDAGRELGLELEDYKP